jgi:hypothetical protein
VGCVVHIGNTVMHTGFWAGKPDRKIPFWRLKRLWYGNIQMYVTEIEWEVVAWNHLGLDRDKWWGVVMSVVSFSFHKKREIC